MALDDLLSNLTVEKDGKRVVNPKYDSGKLVDAVDGLEKLEELDVSTVEGLKAYAELTGNNPANHSRDEVEFRKNARHRGGQGDLSTYVNGHVKDLLGELGEDVLAGLAFQYCPEGENVSGDAKYEEARGRLLGAKKQLEGIKKDPNKYLNDQLKGESPFMARCILKDKESFLELKTREAQRSRFLAVAKYGVKEFVESTRVYLDTQKETFERETKEVQEKMGEKLDKTERARGEILSSEESAVLLSDERKALEDVHKKYLADAKNAQGLTQGAFSYALQEIRQKAEDKAKKPKKPKK